LRVRSIFIILFTDVETILNDISSSS
jgi:hypothetical protein